MTDKLSQTMDELYQVFEKYPLRAHIEACDHCYTPTEQEELNRILHSMPLRQLSAAELESFWSESVHIMGNIDDLKHFLPRVLELLTTEGGFSYIGPYGVFMKLKGVGWSDWPTEEQSAVRAFINALWNKLLSQEHIPSYSYPHVYLEAFVMILEDVQEFLDVWQKDKSVVSLKHLADFVQSA